MLPDHIIPLSKKEYEKNKHSLNGIFILTEMMPIGNSLWSKDTIFFLKNGEPNNLDGPAIISKNDFGKYTGSYYIPYRKDQPSDISYDKPLIWDGTNYVPDKEAEIKYLRYRNDKGKISRLDGPAYFHENESPKRKYYINNRVMPKKEWLTYPEVKESLNRLKLRQKMNESFK